MENVNHPLKYVLTEKATLDLEEIWIYTFKTWSKNQADFYYLELLKAFDFIAKNPSSKNIKICPIKPYFTLKVNSHVVYFKANTVNNYIEIIRILHKRMDIEKRIKP